MALLLSFDDPLSFRFGILLTSLLSAVVLLVGRGAQWRLERRAKPEPRVLTYLADTSYSLYLFHWPLAIIIGQLAQGWAVTLDPGYDVAVVQAAKILALAATFVCAHLSYTFVEKPFASSGKGLPLWEERPVPVEEEPQSTYVPSHSSGSLAPEVAAATASAEGTAFARRLNLQALATAVVAVALAAGAVFSIYTAPLIGSQEYEFRTGSVVLGASQLNMAARGLKLMGNLHETSAGLIVGSAQGSNIEPGSITVIGDSVTVYPGTVIQEQTGAFVDAEVGRSMQSGLPIVLGLQQEGSLGEFVVVALATNVHDGSYEAAAAICEQLAPGHRLVFVTSHGIGHLEMVEFSAQLRELAGRYDFVTIADWDAAIAQHEDWLAADGYHCGNQEAIDLYAQVVLDALKVAGEGPVKE